MLNIFRSSQKKGDNGRPKIQLFDDTKQLVFSEKIKNTQKATTNKEKIVRIGSLPNNGTRYFELLAEQNCLFDRLAQHFHETGTKPDMQVKIDDIVFSCYSQYLRIYSDVFADIFAKDKFVELPSKKVPAHIFKLIYRWICLKDNFVEESDFLHLYDAARFLRMNIFMWNIELVTKANFLSK